MCGIAGILNYGARPEAVSETVLQKMTEQIRHRGPDDSGLYISPDRKLGLGFRRLSIIDLSAAGHQPMPNRDGSIWITFNGEVYNHQELRESLEEQGFRFRSRTDTEAILYAYETYGADFLQKIYGMFAIAIWDARKNELLLARDRLGIKPLYYTLQNGALYFASEIKSILAHPHISPELNAQGLYDYLTFYMTPPAETLFKGIHKLEAGHFLKIKATSGDLQKTRYWNITHRSESFPKENFHVERFCIENIRRLLRTSIKDRMMSDVPFGVLLSGGIDSSLNVALMSELMTRPVETFSIGFKDLEKYNELGYAREVAKAFGTNHHEMFLEEKAALEFLPDMVWHLDEPNADPVCVPMHLVSRLAKASGTTVVQVGEGSDELFSGYKLYLQEVQYFTYYYSLLPESLKETAFGFMQKFMPEHLLTDYLRRAARHDQPFYGGATCFTETQKSQLLTERFRDSVKSSGRIAAHFFAELERFAPGSVSEDYLRKMLYVELKNRLSELLLMRVDKMSMAVSAEARVPFLDHRLAEFAFQIPAALKIKNGEPKYILKKAAEGIIPHNIIYRKKQGFAAPIPEWLRTGKLHDFAKSQIFESRLFRQEIFNRRYVEHLFEQHRSGRENRGVQIWSLMLVAMWHKRFF
ncbi:asparagine synthase (glutamine-hydrolyzing) [Chloroherpeton thalassium ATCC 35110]|uniref:asparagine synthase (glutamine-hydrolyzing) n=1 Tax=Chloroherpeton thalassium (strain ATCC 35110 / GB-78) TaxID=517418 RepID=B3QUX4_CHLT3|nr:asparagine synthase (glutamine-hydrolyzing) [Chloroherpeton thalassium]ACF14475.1 asparagine synthase (glutamine-hydrolyzing) [Chloroherpeton thalassium ATCC 35110]